jgi:hypothetical protein
MTQEPKRKTELKISTQLKFCSEFLRNFQFKPEIRLFQEPLVYKAPIFNSYFQQVEQKTNKIEGGGLVDAKSGLEDQGLFRD